MKKLVSILLTLVLAVSLSLVAVTPVAADELNVPSEYSTIQAAIDAASPGDTIIVAAGTYEEAVIVNKSLMLRGENRETTEIKFGYGTHPSSSPLTILADGVTVSGFTIRSGLYIEPAWTIVVQGDSVLLTDLHVIKDPCCWPNGSLKIAGAAIFVAPSVSDFAFTDSTVDSAWNGIYTREGGSNIVVRNVDFTYPGEYAVFLKTMTGATIERNTFTCTADQYGVIVTRGSDDIEIAGNQFVGSGSQKDSHIGITLQAWVGFTMGDVTILGNDISGFNIGILVEDVDISGISINYNNITDNATYGVNYLGLDTVDATNNWWGSPTGPCRELPNGKWVGRGDKVSSNVDYIPWLPHPIEFWQHLPRAKYR